MNKIAVSFTPDWLCIMSYGYVCAAYEVLCKMVRFSSLLLHFSKFYWPRGLMKYSFCENLNEIFSIKKFNNSLCKDGFDRPMSQSAYPLTNKYGRKFCQRTDCTPLRCAMACCTPFYP